MRQRLFFLSLVSLLISCGSTGPPDASGNAVVVVGTYDAVSANNQLPPIQLPNQFGCSRVGLSGNLMVTSTGRFTANYAYRETCTTRNPSSIDRSGAISGFYSQNGSILVFAPDSGYRKDQPIPLPITGSITGNTLTAQGVTPTGLPITLIARRR